MALSRELRDPIAGFGGLEVLVLGEAMLDSYVYGDSERLCREAPVPVVTARDRRDAAGGAANAAVNAAALGAHVTFLSVTGDDAEHGRLCAALDRHGVDADGVVTDPERRTLVKQRIFASGQMALRVDQGSTAPVDEAAEAKLSARLRDAFAAADAVIVSDYDYGILTPRLIDALRHLQARHPRVLAVDAKHLERYAAVGVTAVKPNYREASQLLNLEPLEGTERRAEQMEAAQERLLDRTGATIVAVTLDSDGALAFERGLPPHRTYAQPRPDTQAAGAGDTFVGTLALALAAGAGTPSAAELASAAAHVVVDKGGTRTCSRGELRGRIAAADKVQDDLEELVARTEYLRQRGQRIVFTNGCFDILHRGHISYLNRAKGLGDVLVVGVNGDDGVRRLKGAGRPINGLGDRAAVLAGLSCVDHIVAFDEDTPAHLIEAIRPDVYAKGGDYDRSTLPEAELVERLGGSVQLLPYLEDLSTSGIIARAQRAPEGASP